MKRRANLKRRQFLAFGSAGLVAPLALGANTVVRSNPTGSRARVAASVGYWDGSAGLTDPDQPLASVDDDIGRSAGRVVPADRLQAETQLVGTGPKVRFHRLVEAPGAFPRPALERLSATVDYRVPIEGRIETLRAVAWHCDNGAPRNASAGVAMTVPVDGEGLRISFDRRDVRLGVVRRELEGEAWFATGVAASRPKLRRGVYFIALEHPDEGQPRWPGYRFEANGADGARRLVHDTLFGVAPVDFDYLIVSIG